MLKEFISRAHKKGLFVVVVVVVDKNKRELRYNHRKGLTINKKTRKREHTRTPDSDGTYLNGEAYQHRVPRAAAVVSFAVSAAEALAVALASTVATGR